MKLINSLVYALLSMTTLAILASCQDEDFGYTAQEIRTSAFGKNFEKEYGKISSDQNWDLYGRMPRTSKFEPWNHDEETRALGGYTDGTLSDIVLPASDEWYQVESGTLDWMNRFLIEGINNMSKGEPFSLIPPQNNDFAIIPIYIGSHKMDWSLHLVTGSMDYKIWSEYDDSSIGVQMKSDENASYTTVKSNENTIGAYAVQAKPIVIKKDALSESFFFYLSIDKGHMKNENGLSGYEYADGNYAKTGTAQRSDEGMMLALNCPIPSNIGKTGDVQNQVMIVGCEDSDQANSDHDMNDLVFLVVGYPIIPDLVEYTRKRYMCEDLGNTYDFDFNDIVVDVDQSVTKRPKVNSDGNVEFVIDPTATKQYATIKHLCGTLPFRVKVGNTEFATVTDPTNHSQTLNELGGTSSMESTGVNWEPNVCKEISGWDPDLNNIFVAVSATNKENPLEYVFSNPFGDSEDVTKDSPSENLYIIDFPEPGNTPLIIAVDQTVNWQPEHAHIPKTWWTTNEVFGYTLTLNSNPSAAGTVQGAGTYPVGSKVAVRAIANNDYIFTHWSDADNNEYKDNPYEFNLNRNLTLTANFRQVQDVTVSWTSNLEEGVTLTAQDENGIALTSGTSFREGTMISLNATYNGIDKEFTAWKIGDKVVSFDSSFDYIVDGSGSQTVALIAQFDSPWWDVQQHKDEDGGNIIWSGNQSAQNYTQFNEISDWDGDSSSYYNNHGGSYRECCKQLVKALKTGCRILKFEFNDKTNGNYTLRDASWGQIAQVNVSNKAYSLITLTDAQAEQIIKNKGIRIEFYLSNGTTLTKVKAYTEAPEIGFTITASAEEGGTASTSATSAESGEQVTLTATANAGYVFKGWKTTDGTVASTQNPWTFSVTSNVSYTASFAEAAKYTITVSAGANGSVDTTVGEYYEGTQVTFTATPNDGYRVASWTKNGIVIAGETNNTLTITVGGNDAYGVEFEEYVAPKEMTLWEGSTSISEYNGYSSFTLTSSDYITKEGYTKFTLIYESVPHSFKLKLMNGDWQNGIEVDAPTNSTSASINLSDAKFGGNLIIQTIQQDGANGSSITIKKIIIE